MIGRDEWRKAAMAFLVTTGLVLWVQCNFAVAYDPMPVRSTGYCLYLIVKNVKAPARGAYYVFETKNVPRFADKVRFVKVMAGLPGDEVTVAPEGTLVGDRLYPLSLDLTEILKADATHWTRSLRLQQDEYWMSGTQPKSYDSRYWGPIHGDQIVGRAIPLW